MLVIRVGNDFHAADGDVSGVRDDFQRVGIFLRADEGDEAAENCGEAGGREIFRELAAG